MADRGLGPVRDDELLRGGAVLAERALHRELDPLAGQRLAVERERAVRARGAAQQLDAGSDAGLDGAARSTDPGELVLVLHAPPLVEEALVRGQLDPVRAQVVGVLEREAAGRRRALEAELLAGTEVELAVELVVVEPPLQQRVDARVLERQHLEIGAELGDPAGLERADDDRALAADLRVEERIGNGERHLVAELRRADRVGDDQDVGHGVILVGGERAAARSPRVRCGRRRSRR